MQYTFICFIKCSGHMHLYAVIDKVVQDPIQSVRMDWEDCMELHMLIILRVKG